jgi:hypothetical protein
MIGDLLDKIVSDSKETIDKIMEVVPFIVIGVLWLLGAIAKTVQASKKSEQKEPQKKTVKKPRPENLADFIRIVKEQYASARAQTMKAAEKSYVAQQPSAWPKPRVAAKPPLIEVTTPAEQPVFEKPPVKEPPPALEPVSLTSAEPAETKVEHPAEMTTMSEIHETHPHPYLAELTKQFTDADGLRKAVLYSEILGRPVALRRE